MKFGSKTIRKVPSFPILLWNCYEGSLDDGVNTNNNIEARHLQFELDVGKHLTVNKLIYQFQLEQKNTDIFYTQLQSGDSYVPRKKSRDNADRIRIMVNNYPDILEEKEVLQYLDHLSNNCI